MHYSTNQVTVSSAALRLGMISTRAVAAISPVSARKSRSGSPGEAKAAMRTASVCDHQCPVNAMGWYRDVARMAVQNIEMGTDYKGINDWA